MDISSMLEVEVKVLDAKENVTPKGTSATLKGGQASSSISQEENDFYKFMFGDDITSVRQRKLHCTGCDAHIGSAPAQATNMFEHPVLRVLLCAKCHEFYGDGTFEQGEDATDMFCRWCANGGNLYCCSYCSNTFCNKCIKRNFDPLVRKKIEDDEKWKCFVCDPADLYSARAVCWALLQHVQTLTGKLQNDKTLSQAEIQEKLNLDETRCCLRKRKAKRRRTSSYNSDNDDTYVPGIEDLPLSIVKRKMTRKSSVSPVVTNGILNKSIAPTVIPMQTVATIPIKRFLPTQMSEDEDDPPLPLITCEQSMVECENETVITENLNVPSPPTPPPPVLESQVVLPTVHLNPIPTANLLQKPTLSPMAVMGRPAIQRRRPPFLKNTNSTFLMVGNQSPHTTAAQSPNQMMYSPTQVRPHPPPPNVPMVAIPASRAVHQKRPRVLLPKPQLRVKQSVKCTPVSEPSVIEIDSDSDEPVVCDPVSSINPTAKRSNAFAQTINKIAVMESETEVDRSGNSVEEEIVLQMTEVNALLFALRAKLRKLPICNVSNETESRAIRAKTRHFHLAIVKTISKLSDINDKVVNKYNNWRRTRLEAVADANQNIKTVREEATKYSGLSLDMSCTRDSDSEPEEDINEFDDMVITDKMKNVKSLIEKDAKIATKDVAIQVYDVVNRNYEECIGHSVLTKIDYNATIEEEILKPVMVPAKYFGKFEEQFIFYLQHIEEHGIKTDDIKGLPDPNETPLKDLIEANSPFISEMLESIGSPITNGLRSGEHNQDFGENGEDKENTEKHSTTKGVEELEKMVTELSDDLNAGKVSDVEATADALANIKTEPRRKEALHSKDSEEAEIAVKSLMEDVERNKTITEEESVAEKTKPNRVKGRAFHESDDECTIID